MGRVVRAFCTLGMFGLVLMATITLVDIVGSKFLGAPLSGGTELVALTQIFAVAGGLAFSELEKRHVRVEILLMLIPAGSRIPFDVFGYVVGATLFGLGAWSAFEHALSVCRSGLKTAILGIPVSPFMFWTSLCCGLMCATIIGELFSSLKTRR